MQEHMTYHVVDSIKGGSGKTTFSIMFVQYLWKHSDRRNFTVLFDMDFIGTGLWSLFYTKREGGYLKNLQKFKEDNVFINEMIRNYRIEGKKYINSINVAGCPYNIAFGSPSHKDKDIYVFSAMQNYTLALQYGSLKAGLYNLLDRSQMGEQINEEIRHIILDMAPGSDSYSQVIKQILFDRGENAIIKGNDQINYYLMVGMDQGQVFSAASYLRSFLNKDDKLPDKIFIVFNDVARYDDYTNGSRIFDYRKQMFCDVLDMDSLISRNMQNEIYFLVLHSFEGYAKIMLEMQPLSECMSNIFLEGSIFSYCARFDEEMTEDILVAEKEERVWKWL